MKEWFVRILMIISSVVISIFIVTKLFIKDSNESDSEVVVTNINWSKFNDSINQRNLDFAKNHPFGFTDSVFSEQKDSGIFRIAVLGDSFIWGDGLAHEYVWPHILKDSLKRKYSNIELMTWGKNGWQTKEELEFWNTHGNKFNIDLLIIGFVDNDPDLGKFKHMDYHYLFSKPAFFHKNFPKITRFVTENLYNISYKKWLNDLYEKENLEDYTQLLKSLKESINKQGIPFFYLMTPSNRFYKSHPRFDLIKPIYDNLGIAYLDVCSSTYSTFQDRSFVSLRANPINFHPGRDLTNHYANEALNYIETNNLLKNKALKQAPHR